MNKNILIAVSGLTPQIITEAFYCLSIKKKIKIDEIYVITTSRGRDIIHSSDKKIKYPPLKSEIRNCCKTYALPVPRFENNDKHIIVAREQSLELHDIRNDKENILFPNKICEFVYSKAKVSDNTLFCCISGGRKTMSVYLAFALSLFGRYNDKLIHVVTSEENEFKNFYPMNKKEDKALEIAEIPYVRISKYLSDTALKGKLKKFNYNEIVKVTQNEISPEDEYKMILKSKTCQIIFANNLPLKIPPAEFELYKFIVENHLRNNQSLDKNILAEKFYVNPSKNIENLLTRLSKLNNFIIKAVNNLDLNNLYRVTGPREHGHGRYGILQDPLYFEILP